MSSKNNWGNYTQSQVETIKEGVYVFVSYSTPVAIVKDGIIYTTKRKFSRTTSKQLGTFKRKFVESKYGKVLPVKELDTEEYIENLNAIGYLGDKGWLVSAWWAR